MAEAADKEDHQHEHAESDLRGQRTSEPGHHRSTPRRMSRGTVAVSTGPSAIPGATPNSTRQNIRMTSAAHSGPSASGKCWKWGSGDGGPQKICFATRRT